MKLTSNKIFSFMLAAAFALTLAGCGGGGGGAAMDDTTDPPVMMCPAGQVGTYPDCMEPGPTPEEIAAATKSAGTKVTAISMEAAQTNDAGLGGTDVDTVSMTISRDADGTEVEIADTAMAGDDDPKFAQAMDLGDGLTMHVRDNGDGEEEVVMVRTDIEAPKATAFAMVHELDANPNDATPPVDQSLDIDAGNLAMIKTDGISSVGSGTITVPAAVEDNEDTMDVDETVAAFETAATFAGAMGTLKCAGDNPCTVTLDGDGDLTDVGNGWQFTPADGATVDVADTDHLHYGFWLKRTAQDDGSTEYNEVETFAMSSLLPATNVAQVEGTASYAGGALGVYVKNVHASDGTIDTATSGHFTADVNLMAYFGGGDVAANKQNTITGTIDNFALAGGEDASGWGVNVEADIANNAATGTAEGGGAGDGSFSANFYGDDTADLDDIPDNAEDAIGPKVLVGEFNAEFTNGSVAGGFGARRQ